MMANIPTYISVPCVVTTVLSGAAIAIRCFTLLVGLLATLPKSTDSDRPEIFREFARAVSSKRAREANALRADLHVPDDRKLPPEDPGLP